VRDLDKVLTEMIPVVPPQLAEQFIYIRDKKLPWAAPEQAGMWWKEAHREFLAYLPKSDTEPLNTWQKAALTIWTGKEFK